MLCFGHFFAQCQVEVRQEDPKSCSVLTSLSFILPPSPPGSSPLNIPIVFPNGIYTATYVGFFTSSNLRLGIWDLLLE